jgi:CRP-like cAMP-binding protein
MRNRDEKIDLRRELPQFAGAHLRELSQLAAATDLMSADAGLVVCHAKGRALETYIIVDGMVDVVVQGTTVASLRRRQIVGEPGVIDGEPRSADVVAATDVTLLAIHASALSASSR